jgi:predicted PurR-regulated permease PerM
MHLFAQYALLRNCSLIRSLFEHMMQLYLPLHRKKAAAAATQWSRKLCLFPYHVCKFASTAIASLFFSALRVKFSIFTSFFSSRSRRTFSLLLRNVFNRHHHRRCLLILLLTNWQLSHFFVVFFCFTKSLALSGYEDTRGRTRGFTFMQQQQQPRCDNNNYRVAI